MNIRYFTSIIFILLFASIVKANNTSISVDSMQQLFISLSQKKITAQMEQNQIFLDKGLLDSINYVINIDSKSLFTEGGLSAEFIREFIPDEVSTTASSILSSAEKLKDINDKLAIINTNRTIKSYMLLVNYMELKFSEPLNIKDIQDAFYQVGNKDAREKKVVANAQAKSAQILEDISKPIITANGTTPFLFFGWIKYYTALTNDKGYAFRTYKPITNALVQDGYKALLDRLVSEQTWSNDDYQHVEIALKAITATNEGYDQIANALGKILTTQTGAAMLTLLGDVTPSSLAMLTLQERIHVIKVLSSESIPNSKEVLINNIIASMPKSDFDGFLAALLLKNDKIPARTLSVVTGPAPPQEINNPKSEYTLLSCLTSEFDDSYLGNFQSNSYQRLMINLMMVYKQSSIRTTKLDTYKALTPEQIAQRKVIWDKSYFLTIEGFTKPEGTNVNTITYNNTNSKLTFSNSYLQWDCRDSYPAGIGVVAGIKEVRCNEIWKSSVSNISLEPYDIVTFTNRSNLDLLEAATPSKCYDKSGNTVLCQAAVPAFFLKYAADKQWNADAFKAVETGMDALILITPVGELAWLGKEINAIYRVAEYAGKYSSAVNILDKNLGVIDNNTVLGKILTNTAHKAAFINMINLPITIVQGRIGKVYQKQAEEFFTNYYQVESDLAKLAQEGKMTQEELTALKKGKETIEQMYRDAGQGKYIDELKYKIRTTIQKTELANPDKLADVFYQYFRNLTKSDQNILIFGDKAGSTNRLAHIDVFNGKTVIVIDKTVSITEDYKRIVTVFEDATYYEKIGTELKGVAEDLVIIEKLDGSYACVKGACFTSGTLILTTEGLKPIEKIEANDHVKSFDEVTQTNTWQRVVRTFKKTTQKLVQIVVGKDTIFATPEHPFYVKEAIADGSNLGNWVNAGNLKSGLKILMASGLLASVSDLHAIDTFANVYNFEVEKTHTYYVGTEGVLVHNNCGIEALRKLRTAVTQEEWNDFAAAIRAISQADVPTALRLPFYKELAKLDDAAFKAFIQNFKAGDVSVRASIIINFGRIKVLAKYTGFNTVKEWINTLDHIKDIKLLSKLEGLDTKYFAKLEADLASVSNGAEIRALIKSNPDDLTNIWIVLKEDPAHAFELAKTGGIWERWSKGNYFKEITKLGKEFEDKVLTFLKDATSLLRTKLLSKGFNINDYEVFQQVQIKTGRLVDVIDEKTGAFLGKAEEYFVADFILVKKTKVAGIDVLDYNNTIVLETKLSQGTALTTPQRSALDKVRTLSNTFDIRSRGVKGEFNAIEVIGSTTTKKQLKINDYIKVWSDGAGEIVSDIISLK